MPKILKCLCCGRIQDYVNGGWRYPMPHIMEAMKKNSTIYDNGICDKCRRKEDGFITHDTGVWGIWP